ncbi:MAG: hydrogenase nickel incorporation protein HypB [Rubricoccaceae bacterium]|nr:hydrogenase nickel incorporation protein HypB [Rubricoccaceae bacterium]
MRRCLTMQIQVYKRLLTKNEATAADVRQRLAEHGIVMFNIMGSPGSGKTTLLEHTLSAISQELRCAVLTGDLATTRDAERIAKMDVPVAQLLTEGGCHLEARLVHRSLDGLPLDALDWIFVENIGNLVCPADFDLGEHVRIVVLSVAEGGDKPLKYPFMFQRCDVAVISKCDLLKSCEFDVEQAKTDIRAINQRADVLEVSARKNLGVKEWLDLLRTLASLPTSSSRKPAVYQPTI